MDYHTEIPLKLLKCETLSFFLLLMVVRKVHTGCSPRLPDSRVARMCYDSFASGTDVYIDTSGSKATDNSTGALCVCNATVTNAKFISIVTTGTKGACGSSLQFEFSGNAEHVISDETQCLSTKSFFIQIQRRETISVTLQKKNPPYNADYCTLFQLEKCRHLDGYQCDRTGTCIAKDFYCDNTLDCEHGDDESNCGSDSGSGIVQTTSSAVTTKPNIEIRCFLSTRFSTTTTATPTTTTTTTTTPKPTTAKTTTEADKTTNIHTNGKPFEGKKSHLKKKEDQVLSLHLLEEERLRAEIKAFQAQERYYLEKNEREKELHKLNIELLKKQLV